MYEGRKIVTQQAFQTDLIAKYGRVTTSVAGWATSPGRAVEVNSLVSASAEHNPPPHARRPPTTEKPLVEVEIMATVEEGL